MEPENSSSSKEYEVLGVIGSGSFGLIRKVIRKRDNLVPFLYNRFRLLSVANAECRSWSVKRFII